MTSSSTKDAPATERDTPTGEPTGLWRRRAVLAALGATVVAASVGLQRWWNTRRADAASDATLAGQLRPGSRLDRWEVVAIHPQRLGAVAVVLATPDGHRFQVDILARDESGPAGVANTERLSLFVSNRGDGSTPTDEEHGLGAMVLAEALQPYETHDDFHGLMTLAERNATHPSGSFGVPLQ